jgi:tetratricopeptide (TPR) repeat protein
VAQTNGERADTAVSPIRLAALAAHSRLLIQLDDYETGLEAAERYYAEAPDYDHKLAALLRLGANAFHAGYYRRALTGYQEAEQLAERHDDEVGRAKTRTAIASVYSHQGRLEEAIAYFQEAMACFARRQMWEAETAVCNRLGLAYQKRGQLDKAIVCQQRYLEMVETLPQNSAYPTMTALNNLGESYLMLYDTETALHYFRRGLALAKTSVRWEIIAELNRNIGAAHCRQNQVTTGLPHLYRALSLSRQYGIANIHLQALYSLALGELQAGNTAAGGEHGRALHQIALEKDLAVHQARALHVLGLYHQQHGDREEARAAWEEALFLAKETEQRFLRWQLHADLGRFVRKPALRQVHLRLAAEIIHQIAAPIEDPAARQTFLAAPPIQAVLT